MGNENSGVRQLSTLKFSLLSTSTKNISKIEKRKERKVLLLRWYLTLDEQLDERLHLKMTIAK
jgi:hypothetical protein